MTSISTQTQQFLMFLHYEDKLTMLYQRIKSTQIQKQELTDKIQYLQFKNKALEKSLFQQECRTREKQSSKNEALLNDVINLEEQLTRCKNQVKVQNGKNNKNMEYYKSCNQMGNKTKHRNQNNFLGIISQQPQISYVQSIEFLKTNKISVALANKSNKSKKSCSQIQLLTERIAYLQKQIQKHEKSRKLIDLQNKRIKRMNEELSAKCKRLEKLNEARSQLYSNFSTQLHSSAIVSPQTNVNGSYLFEEIDEDSLFY